MSEFSDVLFGALGGSGVIALFVGAMKLLGGRISRTHDEALADLRAEIRTILMKIEQIQADHQNLRVEIGERYIRRQEVEQRLDGIEKAVDGVRTLIIGMLKEVRA